MKIDRRAFVSSSLGFAACAATTVLLDGHDRQGLTKPGQNGKRPLRVEDCIRMTKLGDPEYWMGGSSSGRVAQFSQDGSRFVVLLRKGNLERNTNEYSLLLWQTEEVSRSPAPLVLVTMSSSSNREAIRDITWLDDNETVAFLGEQPGELRQLYTFNIRSHGLKKVTNHPTSLITYSMNPTGDQIAFIAEEPADSIWDEKTRREGFVVSTELLSNLAAGQKRDTHGYRGDRKLFFQSHSEVSGPFDVKGRIDLYHSKPNLSPDGKYILIPTQPAGIPQEWKEYSNSSLRELTTQKLIPGQYSTLRRYVLISTTTGESRVLLDSPRRQAGSDVAWSPDSHSVAISGIYLPLQNTHGEERKTRQSTTFAVEVRIPSGTVTKITQEDLKLLGWEKTDRLLFEAKNMSSDSELGHRVLFRRSEGRWEKVTDKMPAKALPEIVLEEALNSRPRIFAVDSVTHQKSLVLDLNPQFEDLTLARVEEIEWKSSDGHHIKGGLYYPVEYVPGKKYPLVIQTHGWNPNRFWIDGPWTSAFAAQALADKNIVVLQVPDPPENFEKTPKEASSAVAAFEGAIVYLDTKGVVDRRRVGLIGFSRTGLYVRYALTHSDYHFAAASVMDSNDGGYFQYLAVSNAVPGWPEYMEGINGAAPFGEGLRKWMELSPGFSADRVQTPFRIVSPRSGISVLMEWEWFAALTRLGKPVELVMLEDGEHILQKPWDRMVSQQGNVDWFDFWLNGHEDPDPTKAEQYARWRELRKLQEENEKKWAAPAN